MRELPDTEKREHVPHGATTITTNNSKEKTVVAGSAFPVLIEVRWLSDHPSLSRGDDDGASVLRHCCAISCASSRFARPVAWVFRSRRSSPKPIPFAGNVHQLPKTDFFKTYSSWAKVYGPIVYFYVFGRNFIVLTDLDMVHDLLSKRSAHYSTRPRMVMAAELVNRGQNSVVFQKYGQRLRDVRRIINSWVGKNVVESSFPTVTQFNRKMLRSLLESPADFHAHVKFKFGSLVFKLTYGIDVQSIYDPYIALTEEMNRRTSMAIAPGRWLCDSFPILAKIPSWMPWAHFRRWANESREIIQEAIRAPFEATRTSVLRGEDSPSWLAKSLLDAEVDLSVPGVREDLWTAAAGMYNAAIDTSSTAMHAFFLLMVHHPEVQEKAQRELDAVIGNDRLPIIEDRDSLPYIDNIVKELLRFSAVVPMVPHSNEEDDVYNGFFIPKGSWVIANLWGILHDPRLYRDPENFIPERFEDMKDYPAEPDLTLAAFGFGRRACPGIHFGLAALFIDIASILSVFDIRPAKDGNGRDILPPIEFIDGNIRTMLPFDCVVTPRSEKKAELVRQSLNE
ncbi:cytochrome P450 [Schizopora paradoxa]|uniref:Cytochrome P450 n=1 Tax=Schizopora paradoxa TaxID=27342 RepID=A0A0H2SQ84_9AGAM|nr:cytochrome P450 [Schizopora paradoxa]